MSQWIQRDISGLEKLTELTSLKICGFTDIQNLNCLSGMSKLTSLEIENFNCGDWGSLTLSSTLTTLSVTNSNINTLSFIKNDMSLVTKVTLTNNSLLSNLAGLSHLKGIQTLDLSNNSIADLNELKSLIEGGKTSLRELILDLNPIGNTSVFETENIKILKNLKSAGVTKISVNGCELSETI